jgi:predicted nucleic acid-binding protein
MHRLWLDTNILIDYLLRRAPFETFASQLIEKVQAKEIVAYTSIINLIHAHYQLRKTTGEWIAREMISELGKVISVHEIPSANYINALENLEVRDFEDAVQFELAIFARSNFFITRDPQGFPKSAPFTICDAATYLSNHSLKG